MDKLKLAHDWALVFMQHNKDLSVAAKTVSAWAFDYADAMQAEADKREPSGLPEALCEVDWCFAPEWAKYWACREGGYKALWCINKPTVTANCLLSHGGCSPAPSFGFTGSHIVERPDGF